MRKPQLAIFTLLLLFFAVPSMAQEKKGGKVTINTTDEITAYIKATAKTKDVTPPKAQEKPKVELPIETEEEKLEKAFKKEQPSCDHGVGDNRSIMLKGQATFTTGKNKLEAVALQDGVIFVCLWSKSACPLEAFVVHNSQGDIKGKQHSFPIGELVDEKKEDGPRKWCGNITPVKVKKGDKVVIFLLNFPI